MSAGHVDVLWLVRHAHTELHGTGAIAGRRDVALSADGRAAATALGETLARYLAAGGVAPRRWVASPLARARDTADALRAASGQRSCPLALDGRLVELDFGDWEGSDWTRVHREHGAALARWGESWIESGPPNGESFRAQVTRCAAWYAEATGAAPLARKTPGDAVAGDARDDALDRGRARRVAPGAAAEALRALEVSAVGVAHADGGDRRDGTSGEATLVVTHGGCVRALMCLLLGRPLAEAPRFVVEPASVCRLERDGRRDGRWRLAGANLSAFG